MLKYLVAFFIIVPAIEIWLLILAGKAIGAPLTILMILLTGVIGAFLAKQQGLETLHKAQQQMGSGRMPGEQILDGILILIGAVVLLTPGFVTDATGFFLLFPQTRKLLKPLLMKWMKNMMNNGNIIFIRK